MRISDWSSDVCSSDLVAEARLAVDHRTVAAADHRPGDPGRPGDRAAGARRPVGGVRARPGLRQLPGAVPVLQGLPGAAGAPGGALAMGPRPARHGAITAVPDLRSLRNRPDRKSVVSGKRVSVRVSLGGSRTINKKKPQK